jgi:hypothetical protein
MNTIQTYKPPPKITRPSMLSWVTEYESLVIFGGFGIVILITIVLAGIFQAGPVVRNNVLYNAFGAFLMAGAFIYVIFAFMGSQLVILGKPIDVGMIIYISIVLFVIFVLGN